VLSQHGCQIAPSTYYDNLSRRPSRRALRDREIVAVMEAERDRQKLLKRFGARKMWLHLRGKGHDVARCTIERLYAEQGWAGALRAKKYRTTIASASDARPQDRVERDFTATAPNQLWVADFTYVATFSGTVFVAFVFDVFSRRIVGWRAGTQMTTDLVLDTLEMAIWNRGREGVSDLTGLIHHNDAGSPVHLVRVHQPAARGRCRRLSRVGGRRLRQRPGRAPDRPLQGRADLARGPLARPRARRDRDPGLRRLVQQRTPPRVDRRPHTGPGRTDSLRCKEPFQADRLRHRTKPPETPGRFNAGTDDGRGTDQTLDANRLTLM